VKKWKNEVEKAKSQGTSSNKTAHAHKAPGEPTTAQKDNRTAKGDGVNIHLTGDKTRDRCIEIVYDALASDSGARESRLLLDASDLTFVYFSRRTHPISCEGRRGFHTQGI
jgi:transcription elongation factor S-II